MPALGHTEPPSFLAVTAELASIADAGEASRGPRRSATSPRRQVLPNDRTPRLTGAAAALGQQQTCSSANPGWRKFRERRLICEKFFNCCGHPKEFPVFSIPRNEHQPDGQSALTR